MAEFSDLIAELNKLGKEGNQAAIKEFFDSLSAKTKDLGEKVERLSGTINSSRKVTNETIESGSISPTISKLKIPFSP